jgi:phospholipid transport system substrate-binding protein
MVGQTKETAAGIYVDSRVTLVSGESYDVRWRLVRRGGVYKVRDAEIIGFEMTSFLNTLFQNFISENGGNPKTLVLALNR